ncbi:MAG: hypothetical protein IT384_03365 [Deltaproteobacteria bacterium]|nr:hypothetical protein [Deltaproteobacteria bacterium]
MALSFPLIVTVPSQVLLKPSTQALDTADVRDGRQLGAVDRNAEHGAVTRIDDARVGLVLAAIACLEGIGPERTTGQTGSEH